METNHCENRELDILSESRCSTLLPAINNFNRACTDTQKAYSEKVDALGTLWQKIVEFIVAQPTLVQLNEDIFVDAYPQTINIILDSRWLAIEPSIKESLTATFKRCQNHFEKSNSVWVIIIKSLVNLVENPWGDPILKRIINNYNEVSREDLTDYFQSENISLVTARIKVLTKSKSEDLALQLVNAVVKFTGIPPDSWIYVYIRVMTAKINVIERCKAADDQDRLREAELRLSHILLLLADLMQNYYGISRELVLTAFSLNPTQDCFSHVKRLHRRLKGINPYLKIDLSAIPPETGKIMLKSTRYNPFVVSSAFLDDCNSVGLTKEEARDLMSIVENQRFKKLSWIYDWRKLKLYCEDYIENGTSMRNKNIELKFLNIDYSLFK